MEKHFWDKSLVFFYTLLSIGQICVSARFRPGIIWAVHICYLLLKPRHKKKLLLAISCFVYSQIFTGQEILKAYLCALLQSCFMAHIIWEESNSFSSSRKEVRSHLLSALNFCEKEFCSWTLRMQNRTTVFLNFFKSANL